MKNLKAKIQKSESKILSTTSILVSIVAIGGLIFEKPVTTKSAIDELGLKHNLEIIDSIVYFEPCDPNDQNQTYFIKILEDYGYTVKRRP